MSSKSSESIDWRYRDPNLDDVEDVEQYVIGGYHPVNIGDVLGENENQYKVIHKLGYGGVSTVWLACLLNKQHHCALKILCADASTGDIPIELTILQHLQTCSTTHPNISSLENFFQIKGPNGLHYCLVLPILGPSIKDIASRKQFPKSLLHKASQQIASGLAYLHSLEICHGGTLLSLARYYNLVAKTTAFRSYSF